MKITKKVNFDICTFCNHKCTFCSNSDPRTIKDQTSLGNFKKVMTKVIKNVEIQQLGLSAKGEVLVNKDLPKIVQASKEEFKIPFVYFSTNGALLTKDKAVEILNAGIDSIKFSINAFDRQSYKDVHLVDDFELVIENFKRLLELKETIAKNLKVTISSVTDITLEELKKKFHDLLGDYYHLVDDFFVYAISYTPKFEEVQNFSNVMNKCSIPFDELYINSDGTLGLCCKDYFDSINFGSLLENEFIDVYNSDEFIKVRDMHKHGEFPDNHLCKNCLLYGNQNV